MTVYCPHIPIRSGSVGRAAGLSELTHASIRLTVRRVRGALGKTQSADRAAGPWAICFAKSHSADCAAGPWAIGIVRKFGASVPVI